MVPMAIVDNDRRCLDANRAARLLLRMSLSELRRHRIDDFTASERVPALQATWGELIGVAAATGCRELRLADGSRLTIGYWIITNLLPGKHLAVFAPARWPEDELGTLECDRDEPAAGPLSPRQREVLSLVATGADLKEIADELTISPATVRTHIANVHRKLGTRNRAHAVAKAMQQGTLDAPRSASDCRLSA